MKLETAKGREAARKSLEDYASRVAADPEAKVWFKDVEKVQAEGYRYSNFDPRFDPAGNLVPGQPKLTTATEPSGGWYTSFEKFDEAAIAKPKMQLPLDSTARFRLEFDYSAVRENVRIPRGKLHTAEYFELLCKDYPERGVGDATQVIVEGVDIPIKAIWDISGSVPIPIYP